MAKQSYPVIVTEHHEDGGFYTAASPNIPDLNVQASSFDDAVYQAEDSLKSIVPGKEFPESLDPKGLNLGDDDTVVFIDIEINGIN